MKCCICGPVKNCGPFLDKVLENIEKIGALFEEYKIVIFYDKSSDNTLLKLKEYQINNPRLNLYVNSIPVSKYRTIRIANARNFCLDFVKKNYPDYPFFIMMDFDDVNCKNVNPEILQNYLNRTDWDALSFNSSPKYYDIWGLSIYPYCFSYNHFENNVEQYNKIQDYIMNLLKNIPKGELIQCISSFNGFSIYRQNKFSNCYYNGKVNVNLIPKNYLLAHMKIANSKVVFKDYGNVNGLVEDCEHRAFHVQAINKNDAKIMISPEILFY
jgi:hypothetical protein